MSATIRIGDRKIGMGHPPYIIAEACINHEEGNGDHRTGYGVRCHQIPASRS